jgi:vitamin B12 transporter
MPFTLRNFEIVLRTSVAFAVYVLAAGNASGQTTDPDTLGTVVISASKSPVARSELSQAVTVISGDDLRARGVARVTDALQLVPGAMVAQNGSTGSVSSLFLRGGESRYTKILIDGVAVNQSGGFFDFSHLTTDNIDRIEIVRGPASVLYGADAVTGVIQYSRVRVAGRCHSTQALVAVLSAQSTATSASAAPRSSLGFRSLEHSTGRTGYSISTISTRMGR